MKDKLSELLNKYWEGNSSLEEERQLRKLLSHTEGMEQEKSFFLGLDKLSKNSAEPISVAQKPLNAFNRWLRYAAALVILLVSSWVAYDSYQTYQQRMAYEQVMQAFMLIQDNLQKGTSKIEIMEDLKYLNTTHELFNVDEVK
ncbi:MAG: hypothetical protein EA341_07665 [Mongoliibacter sp.]|nr:MAG: hypothetical protein EA341_07665 [Mongoliibacter sp.]